MVPGRAAPSLVGAFGPAGVATFFVRISIFKNLPAGLSIWVRSLPLVVAVSVSLSLSIAASAIRLRLGSSMRVVLFEKWSASRSRRCHGSAAGWAC